MQPLSKAKILSCLLAFALADFFATSALPPVPEHHAECGGKKIMGIVMFIAERASVFTRRATNIPSTVE